ncbi:MAG: hypothetical protein FWD04_11895, partial [Conexibacteraceae bacterium]|nr:hypothetical protein [Conexibacteraceae bacterium]
SKDGKQATASITYEVVKAAIGSVRVRYSHGRTKIKLACTGAAGSICGGTLKLTARTHKTVTRRVHGHLRHVKVVKTVKLGSSGFKLSAGHSKLVSVKLHGAKGKIQASATATVQGTTTATRKITLMPQPAAHGRHR